MLLVNRTLPLVSVTAHSPHKIMQPDKAVDDDRLEYQQGYRHFNHH